MQHIAGGALEEDSHRAGDAMVHREEIAGEAAQFDCVAGIDLDKFGIGDLVLVELALDQAQGQLRGVDLNVAVQILEQIRKRADMVFMAMGDHDTA